MKDVYCFKKVFVNGCISLLCLFVFVGNSSAQNQGSASGGRCISYR